MYVSMYVYSLSAGCSFFGFFTGSADVAAATVFFKTGRDFGLDFASATLDSVSLNRLLNNFCLSQILVGLAPVALELDWLA